MFSKWDCKSESRHLWLLSVISDYNLKQTMCLAPIICCCRHQNDVPKDQWNTYKYKASKPSFCTCTCQCGMNMRRKIASSQQVTSGACLKIQYRSANSEQIFTNTISTKANFRLCKLNLLFEVGNNLCELQWVLQVMFRLHANGNITCKPHRTIQCSRMLKYSIMWTSLTPYS
jgi:hypothetical protein